MRWTASVPQADFNIYDLGKQEGLMLPNTSETAPPNRPSSVRLCGVCILAASVLGLAVLVSGGGAAPPTEPSDKEPTFDGQPLFATWPGAGKQKPDAAIILTGQTFGLLQPCGCSRPQKGGLERRMQLIRKLKEKGWPVAGVDLGDIVPDKAPDKQFHVEHALLRYKTTMNAIREMGYIAVGVGKTEFAIEIDKVLGEYALQKQQPPYLLAGNLKGAGGLNRAQRFPAPPGANRPLIDAVEVALVGQVSVGVAGVVGKSIAGEVEQGSLDPSIAFDDNKAVLQAAVKVLTDKKSQLRILLYHGTFGEAEAVAKAHPEFHVIMCRSEESELPATAHSANGGKTIIVKVGDKGRYVGVVGAYKKNGGGLDLHYQLIPLDEFYVTPGAEVKAKKNIVLPLLEEYSEKVRDTKTRNGNSFLEDMPRKPHAAQIAEPMANLSYVGSETCKACHTKEYEVWAKTTHSHALDTLVKTATRPSLRNFDPECVRCHTIGFEYETGYIDDKKTPELKHVGCENCHGPGSGHVANPKAQNLHQYLSPWKRGQAGNLLPIDLIKKLAVTPREDFGKIAIQPADQLMMNVVGGMCAKCHDADNDPNFEFPKYWPKVNHSGLAPPGGWPAVPPKP